MTNLRCLAVNKFRDGVRWWTKCGSIAHPSSVAIAINDVNCIHCRPDVCWWGPCRNEASMDACDIDGEFWRGCVKPCKLCRECFDRFAVLVDGDTEHPWYMQSKLRPPCAK